MKKYELVYKYAMGVLLVIFISVFVALNIITPKKTFSDSENRRLEQLPKFSFYALIHGKFTTDFEKYIADQFPFRNSFISLKSSYEKYMGKKETSDIYIGKDGYLIEKFRKPSEKGFNEKISSINSFAKFTPDLKKYVMIVPNAISVLKDKLPDNAPVYDQNEYIDKFRDSLDKNYQFIDIRQMLSSKANENIYYKTDHHWTSTGAFYGYEEFSNKINLSGKANVSDFNINTISKEFYGTLYSKGSFNYIKPDSVELYIPKETNKVTISLVEESKILDSPFVVDNINKKDKYTVFFDGNHPLMKIQTGLQNGKNILILKDSYANSFIPFLMNNYSTIYVMDLRYYNDDVLDFIKKNKIKEMLMLYNANTFFSDDSVNNIFDEDLDTEILKEQPIENFDESNKETAKSLESLKKNNGAEISFNPKEFFKNDLFIGDSVSEALTYYEILNKENVCAKIGLNINKVKGEIPKIELQNPKNIFILLGENDVDGDSTNRFIAEYKELINVVKEKYPNSKIYLQSLFPIIEEPAKNKTEVNNKNIDIFNKALENLAKDEKLTFLNVAKLIDESTKKYYEPDGIHFVEDFNKIWLQYIAKQITP